MSIRLLVIGTAWALLFGMSPDQRQSELLLSCHWMDRGSPSPYATFYTVEGMNLVSVTSGIGGPGERRKVSTAGKLLFLSKTQDNKGVQQSYASHVLKGHILVRTVYRQRPGQKMRKAFSEIYDFRKQTVVSSFDGQDSCNHDAWKGDKKG